MLVGGYEVIRSLGGGGMSEALLARSPHGRIVVLKRPLKPDAELIARLRDEARIGSRVFHPHLVETVDAFEEHGMPVLVVAYVEGPNLDAMRKLGRLPAAAAARIGCHVAEALTALHGALGDDGRPMRAVHRDVTGRNVVVRADGDAVLIDLGIARADEARAARTETGMIIGTIRYLAPELIDGLSPGAASDLWSLACVVYEMATGEPAFSGPPSEVALKISTKDPLASEAAKELDPKLRELLALLFDKDPKRRIHEAHVASARFRDLEAALGGGQAALGARAGACLTDATVHTPLPSHGLPVQSGQPAAAAPPPGLSSVPLPAPMPTLAPLVPAPFPAAGASSGPHAIARDTPLELDRPARPERKPEPLADPKDFYPTHKADYRWLTSLVGKALVWGLVLAVVAGGYWYWDNEEAQEQAAELQRKAEEEAHLLRKAMEETVPTDGCEGPGTAWAYDNAKGTTIVVDEISQVPKRHRKTARCVRTGSR